MRFFLGTHEQHWLARAGVPLFVSRRRLIRRQRLPRAAAPWALDSGAFTELKDYGRWTIDAPTYAAEVARFADGVGRLEWAAPQDWMCEPFMLERTGLTVDEHLRRTVDNYLRLRDLGAELVVPVLQGFALDDYLRCVDLYDRAGVDLAAAPVVGLGSVCRRQASAEVGELVTRLAGGGLRLHGFGVKRAGLRRYGHALASADSMAWSYRGRRDPLPDCEHASCANCLRYALEWRERVVAEVPA